MVYDGDEIPSPTSSSQVEAQDTSNIIEEPTSVKIAFDNDVPDTRDLRAGSIGVTKDTLTEKINFDEELGKVEEAIQQISLMYRDISKGPY
jgi:hypothetical protein